MVEPNSGLPPERRIEFRVGIHLGGVVEESDGDLMGGPLGIECGLPVGEAAGAANSLPTLPEDRWREA